MTTTSAAVIFQFTGSGWITCELRLGERKFAIEGISDLTDVFGDLLRLALMIATGAHRATASFNREPGEWRLIAVNQIDMNTGLGPVSISLFEFPDEREDAPLSTGHQIFIGDCGALDFAHAVLAGVSSALTSSEIEYWREFHAHPTVAIRALEAALKTRAKSTTPRTP